MRVCINNFINYLRKLRILAWGPWAMKEAPHPPEARRDCGAARRPSWRTGLLLVRLAENHFLHNNYSLCRPYPSFQPMDVPNYDWHSYYSRAFSPWTYRKLVAWNGVLGSTKKNLGLKADEQSSCLYILLNIIVTGITVKFHNEPGPVFKFSWLLK